MNTDTLRKRAQHLRELAKLVADEQAHQAALFLAADCDRQADELEHGGQLTVAMRDATV
jgi:hypothetical protein